MDNLISINIKKPLAEKLKDGRWEDLNDDEKFIASGFARAFGLKANKMMNPEILQRAITHA